MGFQSYGFDVRYGAGGDLLNPGVLARVRRSISRGEVLGVMMGPPCGSFSTAMNRQVVLRDARHPWGLDDLPDHHRLKVQEGNLLVKCCLRIINWCLCSQVPFVIEHPRSSWLFRLPEVKELVAAGTVDLIACDQCMYGRRWRKSTGFLMGGFAEAGPLRISHRCGCSGVCRRTGKPHWRLSGRRPDGMAWTAVAQAYPPALSKALAGLFAAEARAHLLTLTAVRD